MTTKILLAITAVLILIEIALAILSISMNKPDMASICLILPIITFIFALFEVGKTEGDN